MVSNKTLLSLLLFYLLLLIIIPEQLDAASLRGKVSDERGRPLKGVNITVQETNIGLTSNAFGLFSIDNLKEGTYRLLFSYIGYESKTIQVELESDQTSAQNIVMTEEILNLDAVVVTAQKTVEQIQDVPITMSVIDGPLLTRNSQVNLDILSGFTPGFNIHFNNMNRPNYVIRGLTSDAFLASAQPRVSVFYNNIPISRNTGALIELHDMERIEVLKGPQGTLFGRGAQIGSIHLISKKPLNYMHGDFSIGVGNYGQQMYNGMINLPLTHNIYSRFAFTHSQREGFVTNTFGGELNNKQTTALRSSLRYILGEQTIMDLLVDYQEDHPGGTAFMSRTFPNQEGQTDVFSETASLERSTELGLDRKIANFSFQVHHYFNPNMDLTSFISYRELRADEIWDGDGSAAPAMDFREHAEVEQFTFESRLHFTYSHRFSGFTGISYWKERVDQAVQFRPNEQSLFFLFFDPQNLVDERGNPNLMPAIPRAPEFGELGGLPLPIDHKEESFQHAGSEAFESFIDGTFSLNKQLDLTAGLRFVVDRLSLDAENKLLGDQPSTLGLLTGNSPNVLFASGRVTGGKENFAAVVGRMVAKYSFNENLKTYLGYARGRRPNVIQLRADAQSEILEDETVNNYEIGFKGTFSERLFVNTAAYIYDYNDFQTRAWVADRASGEYQLIVKNGGQAHAYGYEASARLALNRYIQLYGTYAYIHARFDDKDSNGNEQEYAGNRFRLTPDYTWSFRTRVAHSVLNSIRIFIMPSYTYKSHHYFEDDNREGLEQEGYGLFHLQCGLSYKPLRLEIRLFAYNILDKQYLVSGGNSGNLFGIPTYVPGSPARFGASLNWDF